VQAFAGNNQLGVEQAGEWVSQRSTFGWVPAARITVFDYQEER